MVTSMRRNLKNTRNRRVTGSLCLFLCMVSPAFYCMPFIISSLRLPLRRIDHDPVDDKIDDLIPCMRECFRRGEIPILHGHLIARERGLGGQADVIDDIEDESRIETGTDQSGLLRLGENRLELLNISCVKL